MLNLARQQGYDTPFLLVAGAIYQVLKLAIFVHIVSTII
jgi:hypothetical protein